VAVAPKAAASRPVAAAPPPKAAADPKPADAARAQALLEGKPAKSEKPAEAGRFVVQVGAFADATAARETRLKVEKLGLKTYTQVAATAAGNRIRVRAGPFTSRADAEKAQAKAQAAGLAAVVLTL
jgi:DedD protein